MADRGRPSGLHRVPFYFDFISPYAYLGWLRLRRLAQRRGDFLLEPQPILFAGLLNHHGQLGPAEIPAKRAHVYADLLRQSALEGFEITGPKYHPFNPLPALRVAQPEVAGDRQVSVIDAVFRAGWVDGGDFADPAVIAKALDRAGLPGAALMAGTSDPAVKAALRRRTEAAIARGVFGVPTVIVAEQLIWGADRTEQIEALLDGRVILDEEKLQAMLDRPRGADRRGRGGTG